MLAEGELLEPQVRLAVSYYEQFPEEIVSAIRENRRSEGEWHARYPNVVPGVR